MTLPFAITPSVSLAEFQAADKANLVRFLNDPDVYQNTSNIPHPYTKKDADNWLELVENTRAQLGEVTNWAIRHQVDGLIGGIGRFARTGITGHSDEIGYWLAAPYRGQGLMTAAVTRLSEALFADTPLVRIEAWVYAFNTASARVLEKAGFQREGYARKRVFKDGALLDALLLAKIKA